MELIERNTRVVFFIKPWKGINFATWKKNTVRYWDRSTKLHSSFILDLIDLPRIGEKLVIDEHNNRRVFEDATLIDIFPKIKGEKTKESKEYRERLYKFLKENVDYWIMYKITPESKLSEFRNIIMNDLVFEFKITDIKNNISPEDGIMNTYIFMEVSEENTGDN